MKKFISLLLAALVFVQCGQVVMPAAFAAGGESSEPETVTTTTDNCPYCEDTLAEDGTVIHAVSCNADYAYDGSADVGSYAQLIPEAAEYGVYVSGDPVNEEILVFYYYEFGEDTVMHIIDWYWDPDTTGLWYLVELHSGAFPESTEDYTWPDTPWILQDYTDTTFEWDATLEFVTVGEPEPGCGCCDSCTGDETCTCACGECTWRDTIWDSVVGSEELNQIGFFDETCEGVVFINDAGEEYFVPAADCPDYVVLTAAFADPEGNVLVYKVSSFDDAFRNAVLSSYCYVEANYISAAASGGELYATVAAGQYVFLYKDLAVATDVKYVASSGLAGEYVVAEFCYVESLLGWHVRLVPDENWPASAEDYVWMSVSCLGTLSAAPSEEPEPENPCGCCDSCTGDETCTCECGDCAYGGTEPDEPDEPAVSGSVTDSEGNVLTDSEGNPITITVSGDALPEGAEVVAAVPVVDGELLFGVYDIKVYDKDGSEWQPGEGEVVTLSIPVDADRECVGVLHFIDHADAIDGDEELLSIEGLSAELLALLQPAIDAYGDGLHVAVETISDIWVTDGLVSFETGSFSLYTPEYEEVVTDDTYTITFTSSAEHSDNANEKTYYAPFGYTIYFETEWNQGENWSVTTLVGSATEKVENVESGSDWVSTGFLQGYFHNYSKCSVTFDADGIEVGDIFQIDWVTSYTILDGKQPRWTRVMIVGEYLTTFDANGEGAYFPSDGESRITQTIVSYQPVSMVEVPTRPGYIFAGWSTVQSAVGDDTVYSSTDSFPATLPVNVVFYAQWEPAQYTVTYVVPDGVTNKEQFTDQIKYYGIPLTLHGDKPNDIDDNTRFQYWVGSDGLPYEPGGTYDGNDDLTLYGLWDEKVHALVYNANGGTGAPEPQYLDTSETDSNKLTVSTQVPTRPGYDFTGWNTEADGTGTSSYSPGGTIELNDSVTLYAQWELAYYAIEFNPNTAQGGAGSMSAMTKLTYDGYANLTANAFTNTGMKFLGWALLGGDGSVLYTNGHNVKMEDLINLVGESYGTGDYTFDNEDGTTYTLTHRVITLQAVWAESTYKIVYKPGTDDEGNDLTDVSITSLSQTVVCNKASETTISSSASRTDYTFAGWKDKDGNLYQYGDPVPVSETDGDVINLTATWTVDVAGYIYTLVDGNLTLSGTITVSGEDHNGSYAFEVDEKGTAPEMVFTPIEGYEISRIIVDGVEQEVTDKRSYTHPAQANVTASSYVVVVTVPFYIVTFVDHDGTTLKTETVAYGNPATAPADPTRDGYTFTGWDKAFDNITGDLTVTAEYKQDTVISVTITWGSLTFVYTQGEWQPDSHTYADGTFTPESDTANLITVTNSTESTVSVNVSVSYTAETAYKDISGVFTDTNSADGARITEWTLEKGEEKTVYLWLSGSLANPPASFTSGKCTVTITSASTGG